MSRSRSGLVFLMLVPFLLPVFASAARAGREVVVYTSVDQVFSEPILDRYQERSGVRVRAVYDVEAAKTVGLVNRLLAEKANPRADVFWNSEIGRTIALKRHGILAPYASPAAQDIPEMLKDPEGCWTGFAVRARVLVYNTRMLAPDELPESIFDLTAPRWKGRVVLGYPLLGTIATHMAALYAELGAEKTESYLRALKANDVVIVPGNSVVRDLVADGQYPIGFTDTDDVHVALRKGQPVRMLFADQKGMGTFVIPNTVALVRNGPNPEEGRRLVDFLLSRAVEEMLARSDSGNMPVRPDVPSPPNVRTLSTLRVMDVDYGTLGSHIERSDRFCHELFGR